MRASLIPLIAFCLSSGMSHANSAEGTWARYAQIYDHIVEFALWSAIETDRHQTGMWILGTMENPVTWDIETPWGETIPCPCIVEANPILAGRPEVKDPYFDFLAAFYSQLPNLIGEGWARLARTVVATVWWAGVIHNDVGIRKYNQERHFWLMTRMYF